MLPLRAGVAGGTLGDAGHGVGVVIAPGQDARTRRRTKRRGVHIVVAQAVGGQAIQVRRGDGAAVAAQLPEAGVVQDDEQHVRRAFSSRAAAPARPVRKRRRFAR